MKKIKFYLIIIGSLFFILSTFSPGMAQSITALTSMSPQYNKFLVSDLGLTEGGKNNKVFEVSFETFGLATDHYLYIEVLDSYGNMLMKGNSDNNAYNTKFSNQTYNNYDILDNLGFSVTEYSAAAKDKVFATGTLPEDTYTIRVVLYEIGSGYVDEASINFTIIPPYLRTLYPVDTAAILAGLNFRWISNMTNMEFHLYTDPRGKREIISGNRLPRRNVGTIYRATDLGSILEDGNEYYWQIHGDISTTHGPERVKGPLNGFLYFREMIFIEGPQLTDRDKRDIMDELYEILMELMNKRAAKGIMAYDIDSVLLDEVAVTREEIMAVLLMIKKKEAKINAIYFK